MARLGISVYPEHDSMENIKKYIDLAADHGFKRIFSCLLSVTDKSGDEIREEFRELNDYAHEKGMEVIYDVAPAVLKHIGVEWNDLSFFKDMHADGIRLDEGFDGMKESLMTCNPEGLKIEVNASFGNGYIDNICSHHPDRSKLTTCHNFYPQRYSGLSLKHFRKCNEDIKKNNLPIAAFIGSSRPGTFGPWPVSEGLCTLEDHRDLPLDAQARLLIAEGNVDDILIANCYATPEEFDELCKLQPGALNLKPVLERPLQEGERKVLFEHQHYVRGDMSEYSARSTFPRVTYADESIKPQTCRDMKRGDIVILNDGYGRYKGELHIVLKDMPADPRKNVIGHIPEGEHELLNALQPWRPFVVIQ
ncbi:DUF871 domain-containing protein [Faecalibaculum rodentium]|uniref:DUF871 domain-containing protein n=1 Tax=Faecalibaculum rodentium TaxID=1702221 RepID=UPI00272D0DA0|nr:MupG family TIM beta-alpha barrel fold protein [Faecalibaculum rodentium]